jgi:hypothetical protein
VILLKLVPQLLGLFHNSSGNISPENIHKLPGVQEKNLSNQVINDVFSHKICGFNRNFGVFLLFYVLIFQCRFDEFFYFLGKISPNFPCHKIEKKKP